MDDQSLKLLREGLVAWRRQLAQEVGTGPPCPFCREPRARRSDYLRCSQCGINWLDEECHLPDYLNRNPAAARYAARMATVTPTSAASSEGDADRTAENTSTKAWRDRQAEKIRQKLGMPLLSVEPSAATSKAAVEEEDEIPFAGEK